MSGVSRLRRSERGLRDQSARVVARFLHERGLSEAEIDHGLAYAEKLGAFTTKEAFVLAMSRVLYSDAELAAGCRFRFPDELPPLTSSGEPL